MRTSSVPVELVRCGRDQAERGARRRRAGRPDLLRQPLGTGFAVVRASSRVTPLAIGYAPKLASDKASDARRPAWAESSM